MLGPWIGVQREICWFVWEDYIVGTLRLGSVPVSDKQERQEGVNLPF